MHKLLQTSALLLTLVSTHVFADASAVWETPVNNSQPVVRSVLDRSNIVSDFLQLVNRNFKNSEQLEIDQVTVVLQNQGAPTANITTFELSIPYEYVTQAIIAHTALEESREVALKRGIDTVEYTLYHLWAHLVIDDLSSDNDSNAEALSSWLMIKGWPNGGEQWFENAQAFGRASQLLDGSLQDYWHEHSLYKSRNTAINCWILGSNPEKYEALLKAVLDPEERRKKCVAAWQELDRSMLLLTSKMLTTDAPLRQ